MLFTAIGADHRCYQIALAANRSAPENNPSLLQQHLPTYHLARHGAVSQGHGIEGYQTTPYPPDPSPSIPTSPQGFIVAITFFAAAAVAASIPRSQLWRSPNWHKPASRLLLDCSSMRECNRPGDECPSCLLSWVRCLCADCRFERAGLLREKQTS